MATVNMAWLDTARQRLLDPLQAGRMPHAWLLLGAHGGGKASLCKDLAYHALCQNNHAYCGNCVGCKLLEAGTHPDYIWVSSDDKGSIAIAQIRSLIETLSQTAHQGGWRIITIEDADGMSISAANALLKTLEEPPSKTIMILLVAQLGKLPATIQSRCQLLHIPLPPFEQGLEWLLQQGIGREEATQALTLCQGAPLKALDMVNNKQLAHWQQWRQSLSAFLSGKQGVLETVQLWEQLGQNSLLWLMQALHNKAKQTTNAALHDLYLSVHQAHSEWHHPLRKPLVLQGILERVRTVAKSWSS